MGKSSTRSEARNWDIARVDREQEGAAGVAVWTETFAARVLAFALTRPLPAKSPPGFIAHVSELRREPDPTQRQRAALQLAHPYVRRDQGRRVELIAAYLLRAAAADPWSEDNARASVWNIATRAWFVGAPASVLSPQRAIRTDAAETIAWGALRVARRGAHRCCSRYCCVPLLPPGSRHDPGQQLGDGAVLAAGSVSDYCTACARTMTGRQHLLALDAERRMFDAAVAVVLGGESRPRARRQRRAA